MILTGPAQVTCPTLSQALGIEAYSLPSGQIWVTCPPNCLDLGGRQCFWTLLSEMGETNCGQVRRTAVRCSLFTIISLGTGSVFTLTYNLEVTGFQQEQR